MARERRASACAKLGTMLRSKLLWAPLALAFVVVETSGCALFQTVARRCVYSGSTVTPRVNLDSEAGGVATHDGVELSLSYQIVGEPPPETAAERTVRFRLQAVESPGESPHLALVALQDAGWLHVPPADARVQAVFMGGDDLERLPYVNVGVSDALRVENGDGALVVLVSDGPRREASVGEAVMLFDGHVALPSVELRPEIKCQVEYRSPRFNL